MNDLLPADPRARRTALIVLVLGAVLGTIGIWWLTSYLETLTELARTNRQVSLHLFRTRVLPFLVLISLGSAIAGAWLARDGIRIIRGGRFPPPGGRLIRPARPYAAGAARAIGWIMTFLGLLLAILPAVGVAIVVWLLRDAGQS